MSSSVAEFLCWNRKNLLLNLVVRNFKVKYKGSIFGYLWTLVIPLSQVLVFYFVYQVILKVPVENYLAFIVTGILPWVFFSTTVNESLEALVGGKNILAHLPLPIQVFPTASVLTNFVSFLLAFPILFGVVILSGIPLNFTMLLFVPLSMLLFVFTFSLSFTVASLFVIFRDVKYIFNIMIQLWLYATPVLYSADLIPEKYHWIIYANPLAGYFIASREVLLKGQLPTLGAVVGFTLWTLAAFLVANVVRLTLGRRLVERL